MLFSVKMKITLAWQGPSFRTWTDTNVLASNRKPLNRYCLSTSCFCLIRDYYSKFLTAFIVCLSGLMLPTSTSLKPVHYRQILMLLIQRSPCHLYQWWSYSLTKIRIAHIRNTGILNIENWYWKGPLMNPTSWLDFEWFCSIISLWCRVILVSLRYTKIVFFYFCILN